MLVKLKVDRVTQSRTQYRDTFVSMNEDEAARYVAEGWAEYVEEPEQPQSPEPSSSRRKSK